MKILLIHQTFLGQFKFLAPALVKAGHEVVAMPMRQGAPGQGVHVEYPANFRR